MAAKTVIAMITMYEDISDARFKLAQQTTREARKLGYPVVIVDSSPDERAWQLLRECGAEVFDGPNMKYGPAMRSAISKATEMVCPDDAIVRMEPEKHPFIRFIPRLINEMTEERLDVVIPRRRSMASYPLVQQYSERLGNLAFWTVTGKLTTMPYDVYFGPQLFLARHAHFFTDYGGEYGNSWDGNFVALLRMIAAKLVIRSHIVDYHHPKAQKQEDTSEMVWRRFNQIRDITKAAETEAYKLRLIEP